jgi:hypothetical protein
LVGEIGSRGAKAEAHSTSEMALWLHLLPHTPPPPPIFSCCTGLVMEIPPEALALVGVVRCALSLCALFLADRPPVGLCLNWEGDAEALGYKGLLRPRPLLDRFEAVQKSSPSHSFCCSDLLARSSEFCDIYSTT